MDFQISDATSILHEMLMSICLQHGLVQHDFDIFADCKRNAIMVLQQSQESK
jgi:hypothetical protein